MNPQHRKHFSRDNKGSVIFLTIIIATAVAIILAALIQWSLSERRFNERSFTRLKAKNAAESLAEYGVAQLIARWQNATSFTTDELLSANQPLVIPASASTFFSSEIVDSDLELKGGTVPPGEWNYIDPKDPGNEFDSQKGKLVFARNVKIYAKAAAKIPHSNDKVISYVKEILQVRDAPLLAHAVFYNLDMEFHPGPKMEMYGPVHANGDIWVSAIDKLYFHSTVTTAGKFHHGMMSDPGTSQTGTVYFQDSEGDWISDYKGSGSKSLSSSYYDSNYTVIKNGVPSPGWRELASNRWDGNVQSTEHSVPKLNLIGFPDYVRDNPATEAVDDALNYAYAIIEPNLPTSSPDNKGIGEKEKYARKAGLIVRLYKTNDPSTVPTHAQHLTGDYYVSFNKLKRINPLLPNSEAELDANGNVQEIPVAVSSSFVSDVFQLHTYQEDPSTNKPTSSFWDARREKGLDILQLDVGEFREGVDNTDSHYKPYVWTSNYVPVTDYNSVVYVEFPMDASQTGRPDKVNVSVDNMGLYLVDGKKVPNPSYNNIPTRDSGFTLATNNAIYVKGDFNADGSFATGTETAPDNPLSPEPPVALAADSITILSDQWNFAKSKNSTSDRPAEDTEVNTALITGIAITNKGGDTNMASGGTHNFPRFLENWSNKKFLYRGSLVALFESEIANQTVSTSYYSPPIRLWGFYDQFAKGNYPPGTPNVRSFRRLDFRFIDKAEYDAAILNL